MSTPRLIEKRLLWAAVLGLIWWGIGNHYVLLDGISDSATGWVYPKLFADMLMHGGVTYSLLSLVNVGYTLVNKRGLHDDAVGFIGGLIFGLGMSGLSFSFLTPMAYDALRQEPSLGGEPILIIIGMVLLVKG